MTQNLRKQPQNLAETVHLISGNFHKFEADRKLKEKTITSMHSQVTDLQSNFHSNCVGIAFSFMG